MHISWCFDTASGRRVELGGGVEIWHGYFQSLRLGWEPYLNVDATQRAFFMPIRLHEIMAKYNYSQVDQPFRNDGQAKDFGRKIAGVKVCVAVGFKFVHSYNVAHFYFEQISYPRKEYEVKIGSNGLKGPANVEKFDLDGQSTTVQKYFEDMLGRKLLYPSLPCVCVGNRSQNHLVPMGVNCVVPSFRLLYFTPHRLFFYSSAALLQDKSTRSCMTNDCQHD